MASYSVDVSKPAENDIRDIARYISAQLHAPVTASKMIDDIEKALGSLANMHQRCPSVNEEHLTSMGYRKLIINNYLAFFSIDEENSVVNVERILYARRDWLHII
jgi:plasmid stabilization system protein ParE